MYTYINKDAATLYVDFPQELDSEINRIGTTWQDYEGGAWVLLTDEQVAFHIANPSAWVEEVFNMQLFPSAESELESIRQEKITAIHEQDRQTEQFTVDGVPMWLDKSTRTSLIANTLPAEKAAGKTETTLWYAGQPPIAIPVPIAWLEEKLSELELYAKATYDTTQSHLAAVYSLSSIEEIENYDVMAGYPEKLNFQLAP